MNKIKFSHRYNKLLDMNVTEINFAMLLQCIKINYKELSGFAH